MKTIEKLFSSNEFKNKEIESIKIGNLHLSSGQIIVCDPIMSYSIQPFTKAVEKGNYPVFLHCFEGSIAYAELRITDREITTWEMALKGSQDIRTLKNGEIFGFTVDGGFACFMDMDTVAVIAEHEKKLEEENDDYDNYYDAYLDDILDGTYCVNKPFADIENNVIMFEAGYGDGYYATYIGLDKNGTPVKYIINFFDPIEN